MDSDKKDPNIRCLLFYSY